MAARRVIALPEPELVCRTEAGGASMSTDRITLEISNARLERKGSDLKLEVLFKAEISDCVHWWPITGLDEQTTYRDIIDALDHKRPVLGELSTALVHEGTEAGKPAEIQAVLQCTTVRILARELSRDPDAHG